VSATLSWWSVLGSVRFDSLEITRPDLDVRRSRDGKLYVAGVLVDSTQGSDGKGADWLLSQHDIVIRDGRVRWTDEARGAPELALTQVNLLLRNRWRSHRLGLQATPPPAWPRPSMCALTSCIRLSARASRTCRCGRASCMPT
jgi:uncharacterized protein YhdP